MTRTTVRNRTAPRGFFRVMAYPHPARVLGVCLLAALLAPAAGAQELDPKPKLFSFGVRAEYLLKTVFPISPVAIPPNDSTFIDQSVKDRYKKLSYGPTIEVSFARKFSITLDALYRRIGYDSAVITTVASGTTAVDTGVFDRMRATSWTIPVMGRFYPVGRRGVGRPYVFAGFVHQIITNPEERRETIKSNSTSTTVGTGSALVHRGINGAVAGGGLVFTDDFNIKVSPEARYTRWFDKAFQSSPVTSKASQIEIGVSLTF